MSRLMDHLRSLQFTDRDGRPTADRSRSRFALLERWVGYALCLPLIVAGGLLATGLIGGREDLKAVLGVLLIVLGAGLAFEVWRGRPLLSVPAWWSQASATQQAFLLMGFGIVFFVLMGAISLLLGQLGL